MRAKRPTHSANILSPAEIRDYSSISTLVTYGMSIDDLLSTSLTMRVTVSTKCDYWSLTLNMSNIRNSYKSHTLCTSDKGNS